AAEAGLGQRVVERDGALADEVREHLALRHARQIGAWGGRGQIELGGVPHFARHALALLETSQDSVKLRRIAPDGNGRGQKLLRKITAAASAPPRRGCRAGSVSPNRRVKPGKPAGNTS